MILRLLRTVFRLVVVIVAVVAALLVFLALTNPTATKSAGWTELDEMPFARGEVAAAVAKGRLYVVGGLRGATTTSDAMTIYDIRRKRWERGLTFAKLHHAAAATLNGTVYVSGGASSVADWEPKDDLFAVTRSGARRVLKMPEGRQGHAMVAYDDKLYVFGGVGRTDRTLVYWPKLNKWVAESPLPVGRDHLRAVVWDNRIWVLGGRSGGVVPRVDVYNPARDTWTRGPNLPEPMSAMAVGVLSDGLHVIGGEDPDPLRGGVSVKHYVLKKGSRRWREAPKPILPVHGAGFGVYDGRLIVAGGASRQGALSTISWTGVTQSFSPQR